MARKKTAKRTTAKKSASTASAKETGPAKGVRYSEAQKTEIVQFVRDHDSKHGRGGQAAAVAKYGVSGMTISKWMKGSGRKPRKAKSAPTKKPVTKSSGTSSPLQRMLEIVQERELLQQEFDTLKSRL